MIEENEISSNLVELNQKYLDLYYSTEYQRALAKKHRRISFEKVIKYVKNGYFDMIFDKVIKRCGITKGYSNAFTHHWEGESYSDLELKSKKVAVYTCNIGNYDIVRNIMYKSKNCDYFMIADRKEQDYSDWIYIDANKFEQIKNLSNTEKNRFFKLHPELLFKEYDYSIYLDSNIQIIADLMPIIASMKNKVLGIHLHRSRECIYKEAKEIVVLNKADRKLVDQQMSYYRKKGFPKHFGLFDNAILIRDHNSELCKKVMKEWWNEICKFTARDQLSLPFVLWKNKISYKNLYIFPCKIMMNPRFNTIGQHQKMN